jgi:predicted nucleic acid-binding protein
VDAFDADVLIYAAVDDHPLGGRVAALFSAAPVDRTPIGLGSYILVPELLGKPLRDGADAEVRVLAGLLSRLDLKPLDGATAQLAAALSASYTLRAADAVHLATAVHAGAQRFITNNSKDFPRSIVEIDVVYPTNL